MPYNPKRQSNILIDKEYYDKLKVLAERQRRTIKATIEMLIESKIV